MSSIKVINEDAAFLLHDIFAFTVSLNHSKSYKCNNYKNVHKKLLHTSTDTTLPRGGISFAKSVNVLIAWVASFLTSVSSLPISSFSKANISLNVWMNGVKRVSRLSLLSVLPKKQVYNLFFVYSKTKTHRWS